MSRSFQIASLALICILPSCGYNPPPFDALALQQAQRSRSSEAPSREMQPLPTTLQSPYLPSPDAPRTGRPRPAPPTAPTSDSAPQLTLPQVVQRVASPTTQPTTAPYPEPVLRLALQEIIQRSVANSSEVRVASFGPAIEKTRVTENQARFDPSVFFQVGYEKEDADNAGLLSLFGSVNPPIQTWTFRSGTGIRQQLQSGGTVELRYESNYQDNNPPRYQTDPFFENTLALEIQQPLLANFGAEVNRARIVVARNNQRIALLDFRDSLEENVARLEQAYWQLALAERDLSIQERLSLETEKTAETLRRRFEGQLDVSRLQTAQAAATVEARRAALVGARARVRDLSDDIKRRMNDPDFPLTGNTLILPADDPVQQPIHFDLQDQINTALENRFELAQQQLRIHSASVAARVAKNNLLPDLSLRGQFRLNGVDERVLHTITEQVEYRNQSYALGFELEIPIGNRAARAIWARGLLQRQQAIESYRSLVDQISLDVKQAHRAVQTRWDEIAASRQARLAAAEALATIQVREDAGEALNYTFVQLKLDRQAALADASRNEVTSIIAYNLAIADLERKKGTLLRYNNILMDQEKLPFSKILAPASSD